MPLLAPGETRNSTHRARLSYWRLVASQPLPSPLVYRTPSSKRQAPSGPPICCHPTKPVASRSVSRSRDCTWVHEPAHSINDNSRATETIFTPYISHLRHMLLLPSTPLDYPVAPKPSSPGAAASFTIYDLRFIIRGRCA